MLKGQNPPHPKYAQKVEALCQMKLVRCTEDKHMTSLQWGPWWNSETGGIEVAGGWGRGEQDYCSMGTEFQIFKAKSIM